MLSRNSFLFKGFIRQSIWKPLSPFGKRTVLNENVFQLIKNKNIITNQKNITDINLMMKGELRCTSKLSNILSPNSIIIDKNDEKIEEKQKEEAVVEKNQNVSDIIESIPIKRNCDILPESYIPATSKLPKRQSSRTATKSKKTLRCPDFEIINHPKQNGEPTKTLIIPISKDCPDEKILCHTFHFNKKRKMFICNQRYKDGKRASAKLQIKYGEEIVELSNYEFIGKSVLYKEVIEKLLPIFVEKPYFEIRENGTTKILYVYTNSDRTFGHKFYYNAKADIFYCCICRNQHKIYISAKLIIRDDGTEVIRMYKHVCEPIDLTEIIVKEPDYVKLKNGQIFIFSSKESNMGYKYSWKNSERNYICNACKSKSCYVTAKPDEYNKEYLKLSKTEHICKPIQYQCDISEIEQPDLEWPKSIESIEEKEHLIETMKRNHPFGEYPLYVWTYVITSAPPESTPERKASSILYVGYSEDCGKRIASHVNTVCVVSELIKIFGTLYMIPIFQNIPPACHDLEALIYQLWECGSLKIQLRNTRSCEWNSNAKEGSLQFISKNPDDPHHADLVLGVKKFLISQISKVHSDDIIVFAMKKPSKSSL